MLRQAQSAPGRLASLAEAPRGAREAARDLGFAGSFARVPGPALDAVGGLTLSSGPLFARHRFNGNPRAEV
eukprot:1899735-Alexandrium_andersonii.AAC.1